MPRYKLRTLLIVVTLLAVSCGVVMERARRQAKAVKRLNSLGITTLYDFEADSDGNRIPNRQSLVPQWLLSRVGVDAFHNVTVLRSAHVNGPVNKTPDDSTRNTAREICVYLPAFRRLKVLWLRDMRVGDEILDAICDQQGLERLLLLPAPDVTDAGVRKLHHLRLREIAISYSKMTDSSLKVFGAMKQLEGLHLQGHTFTDDGVVELGHLHQLKGLSLGLGDSEITDSALASLSGLTNLESIDLQRTRVTDQGIAKLSAAAPKLRDVFQTQLPKH